jgi:methionyl-tRNA formyltransferase
MTLRIVFMGTPDFSVPTLTALHATGHTIVAAYSQPPRPSGRGMATTPSPVHAAAEALGIPVHTPTSLKGEEAAAAFRAHDADVAVVVAYGLLLPESILAGPRHGCLNLHGSRLPRWRGAAPIQRAIMAGDKVTGVEVMRMTEGLDEGPVLSTETLRIDALDTAGTLHDRLAAAGAALLVRTMAAVERGEATETPQAEEGATYAKKIRAKEARLNWTRPAAELDRKIRGLSPFPGAWFEAQTEKGPVRVKALLSRLEDAEGAPGVALDDNLLIGTGEGAVRLLRVQREGKGPQDAEVFLRGFPVPAGTKLG